MKKRYKVLIVIVCIAAVCAALGFFAYEKISVKVADMILEQTIRNQLNNLVESGDISVEDLINSGKQESAPVLQDTPGNAQSQPSGNTEGLTQDSTQSDIYQNNEKEQSDPVAVQNSNNTQQQTNNNTASLPEQSNELQVNTETDKDNVIEDKVNEIVESISAQTKKEIIAMVTSKLSASEISYYAGLLSGGLTLEEKKEGKAFVYSRFSADEIATIQALYDKYIDQLEAEKKQ